jgi:hypothetical protein
MRQGKSVGSLGFACLCRVRGRLSLPLSETRSQFVIPAKSRGAGCEPGSRMILVSAKCLDSGSRPTPYRACPCENRDTGQACGARPE